MVGLEEIRNFRVGVDDVVEFFWKIVADLLDERENVVTDFVLAVLILAENGQGGEDDAFQELKKNFVALSVD